MWLAIVTIILATLYIAIHDSNEWEQYEEWKEQERHNSQIFMNKNRELTHLLTQVADMSVTYMIGHEKEALGKIRELTRDYQSDVNSH